MKYLNLILFILIVSSCPINLVHAFFDKDIRLLTMQDGLADNTITSIYKDDDGFMWFGTNDGISRYDGRTVRNFKPQESYIPNSVIVRLSHDYLGVVMVLFMLTTGSGKLLFLYLLLLGWKKIPSIMYYLLMNLLFGE